MAKYDRGVGGELKLLNLGGGDGVGCRETKNLGDELLLLEIAAFGILLYL